MIARTPSHRVVRRGGVGVFRGKAFEREIRGTDGGYFLTRLSPYRTTDDHIDGAVLTIVDITALRRAEQLVRVGEERLHLAAQSTNDFAIIVQDMDGRVVTWNKGAERIFGYSESEMAGQTLDRVRYRRRVIRCSV